MKFVVLVSLLVCRVCCMVDVVRSLSTKPTRPERQQQSQQQPRHHPEPKAIPSSSAVSSASSSKAVSLLANRKLKIQLDIGRLSTTTAGTAGDMMSQLQQSLRPGWAASGAHLVLDATVEFTTMVLNDKNADNADVHPQLARDGEIGRHDRGILRVNYDHPPRSQPPNRDATLSSESSSSSSSPTKRPSTFISIEHGLENVDFSDGGWYIQRPTRYVRDTITGAPIRPEGILTFWFDCVSGATKHDVTIPPQTRLYCSTGIWDNPHSVQQLRHQQQTTREEIDDIHHQQTVIEEQYPTANILQKIINIRQRFVYAEDLTYLNSRLAQLERQSPPPKSIHSSSSSTSSSLSSLSTTQAVTNGSNDKDVVIAPIGSIVIQKPKNNSTKLLEFLLSMVEQVVAHVPTTVSSSSLSTGNGYLILGKFSTLKFLE